MIDQWHIPIMGFTQSRERESGVERLWRKLRGVAVGRRSSLIYPQQWHADWRALAEFIWRNSSLDALVSVYAYSWGCGHGFVKLSEQLRRRGIAINHAVLCDPVYHHWLRPWRGLFAGTWNPPIMIPANVREVRWLWQMENRPQATGLIEADAAFTVIHPGKRVMCDHQHIDDSAEFHGMVLSLFEGADDAAE